MSTKLTLQELNAIYALAVGATEGGRDPYKYSNAWSDFTASVVRQARFSQLLNGMTTYEAIFAETKKTAEVEGKLVPTAAAIDAQRAIKVVTDGGMGFDGKKRNGMMNSADTVGLGQFDFGGNRNALATKYNFPGAAANETVGEYVVRNAFPDLAPKDQSKIVLSLGTGLRDFVRDGPTDPDPLTDAERSKIAAYFKANPSIIEKLDDATRSSFVKAQGMSVAMNAMVSLNWSDADLVVGAAFMLKTANQVGSFSSDQLNYLKTSGATLDGLLTKVHKSAKDALKAKDAAELLATLKESDAYSSLYNAVVQDAQGGAAQVKSSQASGLIFDAILSDQGKVLASCIRAIDDTSNVEPILFYYKGKLAICDTENGTILLPSSSGYQVLAHQNSESYSLTQQAVTLSTATNVDGSLVLSGGNNLQFGTWFEGGVKVLTASGKLLEIRLPEDVEVSSELLTSFAKNASTNGINFQKWSGLKAVGALGDIEVFVDGAATASGTIKIGSSIPKVVQGVKAKKTSFSVDGADTSIDGNPNEVEAQVDADYEVERKDAQGNRIVDYVWENESGEILATRTFHFDAVDRHTKFEYTNFDTVNDTFVSEVGVISYVGGQPVFTGSVYTTGAPGSQIAEVQGYGLSTQAGGSTGVESIKLVFGIGADGQRVVESVLSINGVSAFSDARMATDLVAALNAIGVSERNFIDSDQDESTYAITEKIGALLSQVTVDTSAGGISKLVVPTLGAYEIEPQVIRQVEYELGIHNEITDADITTSYEASGAVVVTHWEEVSNTLTSVLNYEKFGYGLSFSLSDGYGYLDGFIDPNILKLDSIDGITLDPLFGLSAQDLNAFGFTWSNILGGTLPADSKWLIEGLDVANQVENGWTSPQFYSQDLGGGVEFHRLLLGNGASFESRYGDDQSLLQTTFKKGGVQTDTYFEADGTWATLTKTRDLLTGAVIGEAATYDVNGLQTSFRQSEIRKQNEAVAAVATQELQDQLFSGAADLLRSIRAKDKTGMLLTSAKLAADIARFNGVETASFDSTLKGVAGAIGVLNALHGLSSDNTFTQVNSAVNLLSSANSLYASFNNNQGFITSNASIKLLGQVGAILSLASIANIGDMLEHGQVGSAAFTAVNAINAIAYLGEATTTIGGGLAGGAGGTVAATGEFAFIPMDPYTLVIMVVASIILDELFSEDEPPPPPPVGEAYFTRLANGALSYEIANAANGGDAILVAKMDALLAKLNQQVAQANNGNTDPDQALVLIASRMPTLRIQSWPSKTGNLVDNFFFVLENTHPLTSEKMYNGIARDDLVVHYAEALVMPEAIVNQWQVNHLASKFGANEANWKTEGQWLSALSPIEQQRHALQQSLSAANAALESAKQSNLNVGLWVAAGAVTGNVAQGAANVPSVVTAAEAGLAAATAALTAFEALNPADPQMAAHIVDAGITDPALRAAAIEGAARQWLKVIAIDLGGDGITKTALPSVVKQDYDSLQTDGVARFDADNDGFREATEWIAPSEAMLGIDRDGNGLIDTASELFNGVNTPFDQRGIQSLKYYDSNNDGKVDASDPVYKLLRLWIDLNGDGSAGSMEIYDLQMRHPGVDMVALRARLDAAGQAAMDALAGSAVQSIDLTTFKLRLADGTDAQASDVGLQAETQGIAVVVDQPTQNVSILHENGLRENYITLVQDMSALLELQSTTITAARRTELEAMAVRYGLNVQSADFINVVKSLRAGGENIGASGMAIYIGDSDVWVDQNVRQRLEQMRFSFHAASTVGGTDVFGTAHFSAPVWAGASTDTPAFNDQWALSHHVTTGEVTSDTPVAGPPTGPNPEQWVLPTDVYTLDYVVKGAQLGGLVTQQAVIASNATTPGAPSQTIQVYTTASPTSSLGTATVAGKEDEQFAFGYEQLEQEARTLIAGATPYTVVRLLGVRDVSHGFVEVDDVTGRIRFIADANYFGTGAGFSYAVMDAQGHVMERRINFNLEEVNDAPKLLGETIEAKEDVPLLLDAATLLANDTDLEGDTLTIIGIGRVGMGRAQLLANGQISYKPPADLYGVTDTIEYIVQDSRGGSAVAVIKIKLTAVDDAPTVVSEVIRNAKEDTNLRIDTALLLANDYDTDFNAQSGSAALQVTAVGNALHGQAFIDSSGQVIFVPDENFNGTATFEYTVTDSTGLSTVGKAEVEVGAVNDGPRAFGELITSHEDEKLVIDPDLLLANDEDADIQRGEAQHLMVVAVDQAVNGVVSLEGGHVVFTPTTNFSGEASFRYTVSDGAGGLSQAVAKINVAAVNDAPTLLNRAFQGTEETPINITVAQLLAGVLDPEDGANGISFVETRNVVGGTLERTGDTLTFTPGANFSGTAHFDYVVKDAQGAESTAVVTMSFNNVNDAPIFVAGSHLAKAGQEDQEVRISLSALKQMFVDVDGDAITVDTANLIAVNSGDTLRFDAVTQEIVFKAQANANGVRQFDVRVQDSNGVYSTYERLNVEIQALNDAPVVNALGFQMLEDGGYNDPGLQAWSYLSYTSLLSGATDAENDVLSIVGAANGRTLDGRTVSIINDVANNRVGIMAPLNYNGAITFDFTVSDGHGAQVTQKAYGNVVPVNDLPTANIVFISADDRAGWSYYRVDSYDVEDGSNSTTVSAERHPLWGSLRQGVTSLYVDESVNEAGTIVTEGGWTEIAAASNYFALTSFRIGQSQGDSVTFRVTDSQGGYSFRSLSFLLRGVDPVVIDLGGDGLEFIDIDQSNVMVDRDGDGVGEHIAWIGANEGILAWDYNHDNQINESDEIEFWSHVNPQDPSRTDLQSLARPEFDSNQDGKFDSSDAKWSEFKLWRDLNGNGVSDAGELQTLAEAGLKTLYLNANVLNRRYGEDVLVRGYTRAEMTDGRMLQVGDVQLDMEDPDQPVGPAPTTGQQEAGVISVGDVQAVAQQQQQAQAAAMRVGSPEFSGALHDHKVLTGQAYRYVLPEALFANLGAGAQYSVKLASGQPLPSWLHFDAATRTLTGTPTDGQLGDWTIKVVGIDAANAVSAGVMTLNVAQFNQAPVEYGHVPTQYADEDEAFSLDIAANFFIDKDINDKLRFSATLADGSALPDWLHFDAQAMRFYGTPEGANAGTLDIKLVAADEANATASTRFKIVVTGTNDAPYLAGPVPTIGLTAGVNNSFEIPQGLFADLDLNDQMQLAISVADGSALPAWMTYNPATRTLTANPSAEQISAPLQLRVTATDLAGATTSTLVTVASMIRGTSGNDTLIGSAFSEYVWGDAGNDLLDGQAGADRLIGGLGNDSYVVDGLDTVVERAGEGIDTVFSAGNWTLGDNLENLTLIGNAAVSATGNELSNILAGNSASNVLTGGAGDDVYLFGFGSGQDTLVELAGGGNDMVQMLAGVSAGDVWVGADANYVYLNLVDGTNRLAIQRVAGGGIGIEAVRFADGTLWDQAAVMSKIVPNAAPFSAASTHIRVAVEDQLFEDASPSGWFNTSSPALTFWATLANGASLPAWLSLDAGTGKFSGLPQNSDVSAFDIRLYARDSYGAVSSTLVQFSVSNVNDAPTALALADQQGCKGQPFVYVLPLNALADVDAGDILSVEAKRSNGTALPSWLTFDAATRTFSGTPPANAEDTLHVVLSITDTAGLSATTGFALDIGNKISGGLGAETLTGTTGRDLMYGLAGNDTLTGGAGNDLLDGGQGADVLDGGAGDDVYVVDNAGDIVVETTSTTVYVDQGQYVTTYVDQGHYVTTYVDQGYYIYTESGGPQYDESGNILYDENGVPLGGTWISNVVAQTTWVPNVVPQTTWVPNVVAQTSVSDSGGIDTVNASVSFVLGTNQENLTLTGTAAINGNGNALNNVLTGNSGANTLNGGAGNDTLAGGAGDDILIGATGNDRYLFGRGDGHDTISDVDTTANNADTLVMQPGISASEVTVTRTATQMVLTLGADQVLIDWDVANGKRVERVEFADGTVWTANDLLAMSNRTPTVVTGLTNQAINEDSAWSYTVPAATFADLDLGDTLTYSATLANGSALPAWLAFNPATRTFSGTPLNANVGVLALKFLATDSQGAIVSSTFNVIVANTNDAPTLLVGLPSQQALETQAFSYVIPVGTFGDVDLGDTLVYSATLADGTALPSWLTFNVATRTLSGTPPDAAGSVLGLAIRATDAAGAFVVASLSLDIGNVVNGTAAAETLTGTTGRDAIYGLAGNDTLTAGAGDDVLNGGTGSDMMDGGAGDDIYYVDNAGDTVVETTSATTYVDQGQYVTTYVDQGHYVTTYVDQGYYNTTYVDQGYYYESGYTESGQPNMVWQPVLVAQTSWVPNVVAQTTWSPNVVAQTTWSPNVVAQTTVSDSGGIDTVNASISFVLGINQENLTLTGTAAVNGTGNALNNVLVGNLAANILAGGAGNDTYVLGRGAGSDTVQENDATAANTDIVKFSSSVAADQVWFRQVNNDLEASIIGTSDKFLISNWYLGAQYQVEQFKTTDGNKTLLASQVQNLVNAMASFSPPAAGQTTLPTAQANALSTVIAANWQ